MNMRKIAQKSMLGLLIVLLTAQGWFTGWTGAEQRSYAANALVEGVKDTVPSVNATNVDTTAPLIIDFDKPVKKADTPNNMILVKRLDDDSIVDFILSTGSQVTIDPQQPITDPSTPDPGAGTDSSISGYRVSITLTKPLPGATYYVEINDKTFVYADDNTPLQA